MASTLPPIKNAAYTFDVALTDQGNVNVFQTSVTLAAGDVMVSQNGAAFVNITSLPTEIGTSGVLVVALTAAEMNADRVAVLFHDAAGAEWQDRLITLYTAARTMDALPAAIADAVLEEAIADHKSVSDSPAAWMSTKGSNITSILEDTGTTIPAALLTSQDVRDAMTLAKSHLMSPAANSVDQYLSDILEDTGTTLPAQIAAINPAIAISATEAETVASGALALTTFRTWTQAITSTSTAAMGSATKCWLAIKRSRQHSDDDALVLIEETAGLTRLSQSAYGSPTHGTLVVSGSSGAWIITAEISAAAMALLVDDVRPNLVAEVKAQIDTDVDVIWSGAAVIEQGIVRSL